MDDYYLFGSFNVRLTAMRGSTRSIRGISRNVSQMPGIMHRMRNGTYQYSSVRGIMTGYIDAKGVYYINYGHPRVAAAETGLDLDMNDRLISVEGGFNIQSMFIGPFTLSKGECVAIDFPGVLDFSIHDALFRVLTGQQAEPAVRLSGKFVSVRPMISKAFRSPFMRTTAMEFLVANSAYDRVSAEVFLNSNSIDPGTDINKLGYNDRLLLSLEVAYSKCKNIIISTSGLDYTGIQSVGSRIINEIENGAVIEITYPDSRGRTRLFDSTSIPQKVITVVGNA